MKQVELQPPPPLAIPKPSSEEGGQPEARVDPPRAFEAGEDEVVEVTPHVLPPTTTKRKRNEGAGGSAQHKKSTVPFSFRAWKQATRLMSS